MHVMLVHAQEILRFGAASPQQHFGMMSNSNIDFLNTTLSRILYATFV